MTSSTILGQTGQELGVSPSGPGLRPSGAEPAAQSQAEPLVPDAECCQRCGHENAAWSAPSPLWNAVMRGGCINGEPEFGDMVCAACFMALAEAKGIASRFRVTAEIVNVPLETTTPSGRVWDKEQWLWCDAPNSSPQGASNG